MRETVTTIGGFLLLGFAFWITDRVAYRRGYHRGRLDETEAVAKARKDFTRFWNCIGMKPSPVELSLSGDYDDAKAADYLIRDSGASPRVVEEG